MERSNNEDRVVIRRIAPGAVAPAAAGSRLALALLGALLTTRHAARRTNEEERRVQEERHELLRRQAVLEAQQQALRERVQREEARADREAARRHRERLAAMELQRAQANQAAAEARAAVATTHPRRSAGRGGREDSGCGGPASSHSVAPTRRNALCGRWCKCVAVLFVALAALLLLAVAKADKPGVRYEYHYQ